MKPSFCRAGKSVTTFGKYETTSPIRRRDRQLSEPAAMQLLTEATYGIPLHYVWDGAETLYLHCATEGHKLDCLAAEPRAVFIITGNCRILPESFSSAYESLLLRGRVDTVTTETDKNAALQGFLNKYTPEAGERGAHFLLHASHRTTVLRFRILSVSGKENRG